MAYAGDYSNSTYFLDNDTTEWNETEAAQYFYSSPQPEHATLTPGDDQLHSSNQSSSVTTNKFSAQPDRKQPITHKTHSPTSKPSKGLAVHNDHSSAPSSASEESVRSLSSENIGRHQTSSISSPSFANHITTTENDSPMSFKPDPIFDVDSNYGLDDSHLPLVDSGFHNLSLNNMRNTSAANLSFNATSGPEIINAGIFADTKDVFSPAFRSLQSDNSATDLPLTVQPSKMFELSDSREASPNDTFMMDSDGSSPYNSANSPMTTNGTGITSTLSTDPSQPRLTFKAGVDNVPYQKMKSASLSGSLSPKPNKPDPGAKWPCRLTVDPTPDKSRVETQIPIKLTLYNPPPGIHAIHLPSYTISKPKFQHKPSWQPSEDTLELSTILVCASAMQKDGLEEMAYKRAESDEIPVSSGERTSSQTIQSVDESDTSKPLNGAPVTICLGCITRERKRAARKKTKKVDEEEEWAKDEAKRVIVFNCPEVRDWCVPDTKENPVKEHDGPVDRFVVNAPMRIACYCRHQNEKVGFRVIFTLKTHEGRIVAQAMSHSIMITDDHKQPTGPPAPGSVQFQQTSNMAADSFQQGQFTGMYPTFARDMPFRTSYSTNDLGLLKRQVQNYNPQQFSHNRSTNHSSHHSTSTTPRVLSRPASPTLPDGQPGTKKRRSGGAGHHKVPSGLTMTRLDSHPRDSPATTPGVASAGLSATPRSAGFPFTSPVPGGFDHTLHMSLQQIAMNQRGLASGSTTPLGPRPSFGSPAIEGEHYPFYSAPTSQHPSSPPSPILSRMPSSQFQNQVISHQNNLAHNVLPMGINLQNPPIIQRVVPTAGSVRGGEEITILGSGFCQGLEVMFGNTPASTTTFWGETTLVCRVPPSPSGQGRVAIVFKHQHESLPGSLRQSQALFPSQVSMFTYFDDEQEGARMQYPQNMHNQRTMGSMGSTQAFENSMMQNRSQEDMLRELYGNTGTLAAMARQQQHQQHNNG